MINRFSVTTMYWLAIFCPLVSFILASISASRSFSLSETEEVNSEVNDFAEDVFATGVVTVVVDVFEGEGDSDVGICVVVVGDSSWVDGVVVVVTTTEIETEATLLSAPWLSITLNFIASWPLNPLFGM